MRRFDWRALGFLALLAVFFVGAIGCGEGGCGGGGQQKEWQQRRPSR